VIKRKLVRIALVVFVLPSLLVGCATQFPQAEPVKPEATKEPETQTGNSMPSTGSAIGITTEQRSVVEELPAVELHRNLTRDLH